VKKKSPRKTPLAAAVDNAERTRTSPLDVLKLARRHWLKGEKISIDGLAKESGLSRVTIYRWVGSKDYLMGEVVWSAFEPAMNKVMSETPGTGLEHILEVHRRLMAIILSFPPMQRFILDDPAYAMRIVSTDASSVIERMIQATTDHLKQQADKGHFKLPAPAREVAELIIRINSSIMYSDIISGRSPAIEQASKLDRMVLLGGAISDARGKPGKKQ
jgi:AcrR family transcriptional regulator